MDRSVDTYTTTCPSCQRCKHRQGRPLGKFQPLPIPERPSQSISLDLITDLPKSHRGDDAIAVFVCRLSKMMRVIPVSTNITAERLAEVAYDWVFLFYGQPDSIVSDRDPKFTGTFWQTLFKLSGTSLDMSTAHHPQTDGQTERANRTLEEMLRHYVDANHNNWCDLLPQLEFAYNSSVQASTGFTPFKLVLGYEPTTPLQLLAKHPNWEPANPSVTPFMIDREIALSQAKLHVKAAQHRQAAYADKRRAEHTFAAGDKVLLSTAHLKLVTGDSRTKFNSRYVGPFTIEAMVSKNAARLKLPAHMQIHPVVNVRQLRPFRTVDDAFPDRAVAQATPEPFVNSTGDLWWHVEAIVSRHITPITGRVTYGVKFKGYDESEKIFINEAKPLVISTRLLPTTSWSSLELELRGRNPSRRGDGVTVRTAQKRHLE
ncbi:hypothetical protein VaNZ11_012060 [Volvox africanus]|uniref:Integrase catalytic domain-containing protein n=1 Tax=Volvox africanus TaxID=51714 RepID=A0ABQ5SD28_9CHLO|nr:hypothetical protein VaNZ11_012060 [Volvox africanus]